MHQLIFYKGEYGTLWDKLICFITDSKYSHVELRLPDGKCWSSSIRDKGVRFKYINTDSGHWDIVPCPSATESVFLTEEGKGYDYVGIIGTITGLSWFSSKRKWFCSEIVAEALGLQDSWKYTPESLYRTFNYD